MDLDPAVWNRLLAVGSSSKLEKINLASVAGAYGDVLSNWKFLCWAMSSGMQIGIFSSLLRCVSATRYQPNTSTAMPAMLSSNIVAFQPALSVNTPPNAIDSAGATASTIDMVDI